jgi:asparagine synthase (glutamine-hydrolysing)
MVDSLLHRGPDDFGTHAETTPEGLLWFGHRRLSILDLTRAGHQPMATADGDLRIVFNGEIYNFREIREGLRADGCRFESESDTEVILQCWRRWGIESLSRFRGMFAFALWERSTQALWLVRDRMGEKPLYYFDGGTYFVFASEVRTILASGVVPRQLDSNGLDSYLTFGSAAEPYTLVRGVRAVEAGQAVRVHARRLTSRTYWTLRDVQESSSSSPREEIVASVGTALREAVRLTTVSDVPVAALLSGGIDSTSNVTLLTEQGNTDLRTFSVVFEGQDSHLSEEKWSNLVASRFGTAHTRISVSEAQARSWVPEAIAAMDQPSWDGVNTYLVCKAISKAGIKVAISGQGSDELFLGYSQRNLFGILYSIACLPLRWSQHLVRWVTPKLPLDDTRYEKLAQLVGTENALGAAYLAQHSIFSESAIERLRGTQRPPQTRFIQDNGGATALGKLSRLELTHYLRNTLLRDGDQMSMAHSLELRAPFVDHKLVELVSALPSDERLYPQERQKPLLVDAVGPRLPAEIASRPKQGFGLPYARWLRSGLSLDTCDCSDLGLEPAAVAAVKRRFLNGGHYSRYWTLQVLGAWAANHHLSMTQEDA